MTCFDTDIYLCGTLVAVRVDYTVIDDIAELESAAIVGVYGRFDNVARRDYASLGADIPLDVSEMTAEFFDQLTVKAQEHNDTWVDSIDEH